MALDFSVLQGMDPAGAFFRGQEAVRAEQDRNMLRQQQAEQMQFQRENMLAQREQRLAMASEREAAAQERAARVARQREADEYLTKVSDLFAQNNLPLTPETAQQGLAFAIRSGDKNAIEMMSRTVQAMQDKASYEQERSRLGLGAPGATVGREQVQNMLLSTNPQIVAQGKALMGTLPKEAEPTAGMREYQEAVRQGFKGTFMEYKQALQPKPAQTVVKLPEQEKAFEAKLGAEQAEKLVKDKAAAEDARSIVSTIEEGRRLLKSGIITGFGADFLTGLGAALNQAGISFAEDSVANTQAFTANMAANVGRIIKQFGAGTGLSNADREYAEKMAGGKVTLDRKSIERILDINERMARNVISLHNRNAAKVKTNVPLTVDEPPRAGGASVTLPDGRVMNFPNAEAAAAFKKAAGL
jgi:hypothetical protein